MSCRNDAGSSALTSYAHASTGVDEREVQRAFHALKREGTRLNAPDPTVAEVTAFLADQQDQVRADPTLSPARRQSLLTRLETAASQARDRVLPAGATFHAWRRILTATQDPPADPPPPLADYQIIGVYSADRTERACWHCGAGIANVVVVRHPGTGEQHVIGTTCAERVGLDRHQLRAALAERYAAERARRSATRTREARERREREEAAAESQFGAHGTEGRFAGGCRCDECRPAAPHGTGWRLEDGNCRCPRCIDAAVASNRYTTRAVRVLLDAHTGQILPARRVRTRFGLSWAVDDPDGSTRWYPYSPARRSTLVSKGVTEAEVTHLFPRSGGGPVCAIGRPEADAWGEPLGGASEPRGQ